MISALLILDTGPHSIRVLCSDSDTFIFLMRRMMRPELAGNVRCGEFMEMRPRP